jgi:hypothetical protein
MARSKKPAYNEEESRWIENFDGWFNSKSRERSPYGTMKENMVKFLDSTPTCKALDFLERSIGDNYHARALFLDMEFADKLAGKNKEMKCA